LFSSANILLVRFVLHLQDWWCVGKRETSFPVKNCNWFTCRHLCGLCKFVFLYVLNRQNI